MGARGRNFYNDIARRYGYEEAAQKHPGAYLAGRKDEATAAVPDALVDEVALCGPRERIRERLAEWKTSGATTLMVAGDTHRRAHDGRARPLGGKIRGLQQDETSTESGRDDHGRGLGHRRRLGAGHGRLKGARVLVVDLNESGAKATVERSRRPGARRRPRAPT